MITGSIFTWIRTLTPQLTAPIYRWTARLLSTLLLIDMITR